MYHGGGKRQPRMVGQAEVLASRPDLAQVWEPADRNFPVRITRSFWERIDPADPQDPLALQVLPDERELLPDPDDLLDPVGDSARSPVPWVVHKYRDRVLLLLTKRCHLYCRYCFRRDHQPGEAQDPTEEELRCALDYVRASGVREVILSGGDPLAVPLPRLLDILDQLRPAVPVVRVHTRAPITFPESVTSALVAGLRARTPVWVVVHCNHPRELSPEVDAALAALVDGGIPVLNQTVLLRGVNDQVEVLESLFDGLMRRRVEPYYLHVTDRARGNSHLRVELPQAVELYRQLRARLGGIVLPRLVLDPPEGTGKVDAESRLG
jgi:lysine 2,3-aminomutase